MLRFFPSGTQRRGPAIANGIWDGFVPRGGSPLAFPCPGPGTTVGKYHAYWKAPRHQTSGRKKIREKKKIKEVLGPRLLDPQILWDELDQRLGVSVRQASQRAFSFFFSLSSFTIHLHHPVASGERGGGIRLEYYVVKLATLSGGVDRRDLDGGRRGPGRTTIEMPPKRPLQNFI